METTPIAQGRLLLALLRFYFSPKTCSPPPAEELDLSALLTLARRHDIGALLGSALHRAAIALTPELEEAFAREDQLAMYRYLKQENAFAIVCETLEQAGVCFMPLKGIRLRNEYPEPYLRTGSDIDILYRGLSDDELIRLLDAHPDIVFDHYELKDLSFTVDTMHLEMHWSLFEKSKPTNAYFAPIWERANAGEATSRYEMDPNDFYLYTLAHNAHHMTVGGCGIRQVTDLYIMQKHFPLSKERVRAGAEQLGLTRFHEQMERLIEAWFESGVWDETIERLTAYILSAGVYGTRKNAVALSLNAQTSERRTRRRIGYFFARLFPSLALMKVRFPLLRRHPYLLPLCYFLRIFRIFQPTKRKNFNAELAYAESLSDEELQTIYHITKELGLIE